MRISARYSQKNTLQCEVLVVRYESTSARVNWTHTFASPKHVWTHTFGLATYSRWDEVVFQKRKDRATLHSAHAALRKFCLVRVALDTVCGQAIVQRGIGAREKCAAPLQIARSRSEPGRPLSGAPTHRRTAQIRSVKMCRSMRTGDLDLAVVALAVFFLADGRDDPPLPHKHSRSDKFVL